MKKHYSIQTFIVEYKLLLIFLCYKKLYISKTRFGLKMDIGSKNSYNLGMSHIDNSEYFKGVSEISSIDAIEKTDIQNESLVSVGEAGLNKRLYGFFDLDNNGRITLKEIKKVTKGDVAPKPQNMDKNKMIMSEEMQVFDEYSQKSSESIEEFENLKGKMGMQQPIDTEEKLFSGKAVQRLRDYGLEDNVIKKFLESDPGFTGVNLAV